MIEKLILDTDIGSDVDDALALLYTLRSSDLELGGVTTVYGDVDTRAKIARKILDSAGKKEIPVYIGESIPMRTAYKFIWHTGKEGEDTLSPLERVRDSKQIGVNRGAVDFLIDIFSRNPKEYNLVSIGALTNVARALEKDPSIADKIKHHYIMGGGVGIHCGESPEHNIACDVEAAQRVFQSDTPRTLVPLNVTSRTPIKRKTLERLSEGDDLSKALSKEVKNWFEYRDKVFGKRVEYTCMHDPLTVALINNPQLVKITETPLSITYRGLVNFSKGYKSRFVTDIYEKKFRKHFLKTLGIK